MLCVVLSHEGTPDIHRYSKLGITFYNDKHGQDCLDVRVVPIFRSKGMNKKKPTKVNIKYRGQDWAAMSSNYCMITHANVIIVAMLTNFFDEQAADQIEFQCTLQKTNHQC